MESQQFGSWLQAPPFFSRFFCKKKNSAPLSSTSGGSVAKQTTQALISNSVISNPSISVVSLSNIPNIPSGFEGHHISCGQHLGTFMGYNKTWKNRILWRLIIR